MIERRRVDILLIIVSLTVSLLLTLLPMPASISAAWPAFYTMTIMCWTAMPASRFGLVAAWFCGMPLDVLYGTPLSEHGLAMAAAAYAVIKTRGLLWRVSIVQRAFMMLAVFGIYEFVLFWIDGATGVEVDQWWRWLPAISSAVLWPMWAFILERIADPRVG